MSEREVKIELYFLESSKDFEDQNIQTKRFLVSKKGNSEFTNWFFINGVLEIYTENWEDHKKKVIRFCSSIDLKAIQRYREERNSNYFKRLKNFAFKESYRDTEIIHKKEQKR